MNLLKILVVLALSLTAALAQMIRPEGRLTLTSNTPVMTSDVVNASTIYYTPYGGNNVQIYNGTGFVNYGVAQLTMTLNSSSQVAGDIYDLFLAYNSTYGVIIGAGPAWSSSTSRGSGSGSTQLATYNGLYVNANTIALANGTTTYGSIPAYEATYVGSVYMTANGQTSVQFKPTAAAGGTNNFIGLYNAYNRVPAYSLSRDLNTDWTYSSSTWRSTDGSTSNRITWLDGLQQSPVRASCSVQAAPSATNTGINIGVDLNSTTTAPNVIGTMYPTLGASYFLQSPQENFAPQFGLNYIQAMEGAPSGVSVTFYASGIAQTLIFQGEY